MAERVEQRGAAPFFSICVPQYNRTSFLIEACRSLAAQSFRDFELCISDDRSTDGREAELLDHLRGSGLSFVWEQRERNLRYDGNLRAAITLARGRYCFLLGNDDALAGPAVLQQLVPVLLHRLPVVALCNYVDYASGAEFRRVSDGPLGHGPEAAVRLFRHFSFVSGVILRTEEAQACATTDWDGSEMYQMYLASRALAAGGVAHGFALSAVRKDIVVVGEAVDSYARRARLDPCPIEQRRLNLVWIPRLMGAALAPYVPVRARSRLNRRVFLQLIGYTYPFWLFEYRRIQSWRYAVGIALGMRPRNLNAGQLLSRLDRWRVIALYALVTAGGLLIPRGWFERARGRLFALAKSTERQSREAIAS
ncbi:MAG: glycosyltransferase family 2 protein [Longimicrobiales bacterium]